MERLPNMNQYLIRDIDPAYGTKLKTVTYGSLVVPLPIILHSTNHAAVETAVNKATVLKAIKGFDILILKTRQHYSIYQWCTPHYIEEKDGLVRVDSKKGSAVDPPFKRTFKRVVNI